MITSAVVMRLLAPLPSAIYSCVLYHYIIEQAINKGVMIRATQQPGIRNMTASQDCGAERARTIYNFI